MLESLKKWWREKQVERERQRQIEEYYYTLFPLWKYLGFQNEEEWDDYSMDVFSHVDEECTGYNVTKCPDGSWVVWVDFEGTVIGHIAFSTWEETVQFLYEEHQKYGAEDWGAELFYLEDDQDPFLHEPNFETYRQYWEDN
jgi:hypothetical protein